MRKQIWITCLVILAICLGMLLSKKTQHPQIQALGQDEVLTNKPSMLMQSKIVRSQSNQDILIASNMPAQLQHSGETFEEYSNALYKRGLADWQRPIEFYGKVVDENTNPIEGASISFAWSEKPAKEGEMRASTVSDSNGLFSLHGKHGPSLEIWFSKDGYYSSHHGQLGVSYYHGDFSPDSQNPVIFNLRKKAKAETLIIMKRNYGVPRDGTPLGIDLTTGKAAITGNGDLIVRCWTNDQGRQSGEKYDWHCLLAIPTGGIMLTDEEFPFLAPENGYAPTNEIAMPADRTDWTSQVNLKLYYRLADGRYGRMTFAMIAGGQYFCMIDSVLNPTGSRNLEPCN